MVAFKYVTYLNSLLSDGGVGVCEAMNNMRENLGVDCCLIQILNELLHLRERETWDKRRNNVRTNKCFYTLTQI